MVFKKYIETFNLLINAIHEHHLFWITEFKPKCSQRKIHAIHVEIIILNTIMLIKLKTTFSVTVAFKPILGNRIFSSSEISGSWPSASWKEVCSGRTCACACDIHRVGTPVPVWACRSRTPLDSTSSPARYPLRNHHGALETFTYSLETTVRKR